MELKQLQTKINQEYDVECIQRELEEIDRDTARQIIVSMDDQKVYKNVNMRKFQSDYICDYLGFLWDISKKDFWRHVKASFELSEGLLWGDNMIHCQKMIEGGIPEDVWVSLVYFALNVEEERDIDALGCVLKVQINKFRKQQEIIDLIQCLPESSQAAAKKRIKYMLESPCHYSFD